MKEILKERKDCIKNMEDPYPSSSFLDHYNTMSSSNSALAECLDFSGEGEKSSSLGFMELLNMQDFGPSSIFDVFQDCQNSTVQIHRESSWAEGFNAPATPNSSTISSESSGGVQNDGQTKEDEDEEEDEENQKTKKPLKAKKASQKRQREPRFAFMTKSEVDHLEDGYRWRKYGQKAVKNSPFPRSYYRCTSSSCNVKKRVERSCKDPSTVVTTYEGKHTHPSPATPRAAALPPYSGFSSYPAATPPPVLSHRQPCSNSPVFANCGFVGPKNIAGSGAGAPQWQFGSQSPSGGMLTDHGLLQDIVPWSVIKNEDQ